MKPGPSPRYETRRRKQLLDELVARARTRLPDWHPDGGHVDLAKALFEIAARLGSEVAQRLDRIPEKNRHGLMHWLGIRGDAGRAARAPVVFTMTPGAEPIDAPARIQLQATEVDPPVSFETGAPLRILPARLKTLVAARPEKDSFVIAPSPILATSADGALPTRWLVHTVTRTDDGAEGVAQVSPMLGLTAGTVLRDENGTHFEVAAVAPDTITLRPAPPLNTAVAMTLADCFAPFEAASGLIERQLHALYIGDEALLDVATAATISMGGSGVAEGLADAAWEYWGTGEGKDGDGNVVKWRAIEPPGVEPDGKLKLAKGTGNLEPREIGGHKKRWLRVRPKKAFLQSSAPFQLQDIRLAVSFSTKPDDATDLKGLAREGIANTTPLVLSAPFYPFGREPRLFDSFYLGCAEAFSKAGAQVTLTFDIGDQIATPLIPVEMDDAVLLFAIGNDGGLKRFRLGPSDPTPVPLSTSFPTPNGQFVRLDPKSRPTAIRMGNKVHVACAAQREGGAVPIWIFEQSGFDASEKYEWKLSATLNCNCDSRTDPIIVAGEKGPRLYGISDGIIKTWTDCDEPLVVADPKSKENIAVTRLIPVQRIEGGECDLVAIVPDKSQFLLINEAGVNKKISSRNYSIDIESDAIAWESKKGNVPQVSIVCFVDDNPQGNIVAFRDDSPQVISFIEQLPGGVSIGSAFGAPFKDTIYFSAGNKLYSWRPFSQHLEKSKPILEASPAGRQLVESPTVAAGRLIAPLVDAQTAASPAGSGDNLIDLEACPFATLTQKEATSERLIVVSEEKIRPARLIDFNWGGDDSPKERGAIVESDDLNAAFDLFIRDEDCKADWSIRDENGNNRWILTTTVSVVEGTYIATNIKEQAVWMVGEKIQTAGVKHKNQKSPPASPGSKDAPSQYPLKKIACARKVNIDGSGIFVLTKAATWDKKTVFVPYKNLPKGWSQKEVSFRCLNSESGFDLLVWSKWRALDDEHAVLVEMDTVMSGVTRIYAHHQLAWTSTESNHPRRPELSWEYWNGKSWWQIAKVKGYARNLVTSDNVNFPVPADLQPTDVLGRRNHWVRARLVGGDYGEAQTTVVTVTDPPNTQTQTVRRDSSANTAPYVTRLKIGYTMEEGVAPQVVLTEDNGSLLDQSGAARTPNARVSVFTPLNAALAALEADPLVQNQAGASPALYMGFDGPLTGTAVSLFFLVDELDGGMVDGVRLAVDALGKDGFRQVSAVDDQTGGLRESGMLTLNLPAPPVQTRLFGEDAWWLRLRPALAGQMKEWRPRLKGAWLNGCWALAAETIELERLGSSDGAPGQILQLARPPVIADSLELRVREPLGDEDVDALLKVSADAVRQDLPDLPGAWVLWEEVPDIDDAGPGERAYALDDESGEIRFGDGLHGRIPPIGRDVILAVAYRKGGGAVANGVRAWSKMNLVTPLQGVERATIVEGAAGGADPQRAETALAFAPETLSVRDRALTLRDLSTLACQSSPRIAQAFAFQTGESTCLVVVMAGRDPRPSQAMLRELRSYLAERSLPSLIRKLELRGPSLVAFRVELTLCVDALAYSGQLAANAMQAVDALLHPAHGGLDGQGWPLGAQPGEADIAAVLGTLEHIRGIEAVTLERSDEVAITRPLAPHQLAVLAPDGVHCVFTVTGGTAHA